MFKGLANRISIFPDQSEYSNPAELRESLVCS
jgi:hypothetical protein